jgi:hypothetical protein
MAIIKCPRCDINFIREEDGVCSICKREMKGEMPKEELPDMCIECGENPALPGEDLCAVCLADRKMADAAAGVEEEEEDVSESEVEAIDVALPQEDIPDTELEVIHKELGLDEVEQEENEGADEEDDDDSQGF